MDDPVVRGIIPNTLLVRKGERKIRRKKLRRGKGKREERGDRHGPFQGNRQQRESGS